MSTCAEEFRELKGEMEKEGNIIDEDKLAATSIRLSTMKLLKKLHLNRKRATKRINKAIRQCKEFSKLCTA
jgi:hypothetical protein